MKEQFDDPLHESALDSERVFDGALLKVWRDRVRLPNGGESVREYVRHPGAVVVVAQLPDGSLLFERQFRYPLGKALLELPAGKIDPGEEVLVTAQRELLEETGYTAGKWRHVGLVHPCVGYSNERIEIFLAEGLQKHESGQSLDHEEFLDVFTMSLDQALAAVRSGDITDAKTVACLFWAEKILRSGW